MNLLIMLTVVFGSLGVLAVIAIFKIFVGYFYSDELANEINKGPHDDYRF